METFYDLGYMDVHEAVQNAPERNKHHFHFYDSGMVTYKKKYIDFYKRNSHMEKIKNPHQMMIGSQYKLTEPVYDDYDEGLKQENDFVEVIGKTNVGFILRNLEYGFTYERTFQHLMNCEIFKI